MTRLLRTAPSTVWQLPGDFCRLIRDHVNWAEYRGDWRRHGRKWAVSGIRVEGQEVEITGWALSPPEIRADVTFTVDGRAFDHVTYPFARPDVAAALPKAPWAEDSGFTARGWLPEPAEPGQVVRFECINLRSGERVLPTYYPRYYREPSPNDPPLPDAEQRLRSGGSESAEYFALGGANQFERLRVAARTIARRDFRELRGVLDWGCGHGRLGRYFTEPFTGADVAPDAIAWCRSHLSLGQFEVTPAAPPMPFADGSFDLVLGVSVFTHLPEADQHAWLAELKRITRPGAVVLLTVHGGAYVWMAGSLTRAQDLRRRRVGFLAVETPPGVSAFHSRGYVRQNWTQYFEIREILPGYIGNQDLVVAVRAAP